MSTASKVIVLLVFTLAGVLFFHSLTTINADIGRHIKLGEIIWQSGEVPKTNSLSFTAPDFPFINHHWLSEVIFYGIYSTGDDWLSGLRSVMIFKIIILLATYFLLFLTVKRYNIFSVVLAFLFSVFVFSARTEPRPEMFSYLIFAAYLLLLYKNRISNFKLNSLWILPVFQLFWVNLHIYFVIGPIIYSFYLAERAILRKINKEDLLVGFAIVLVNLINPNFVAGALYPFQVFNNYGYSIVENSSLFFLASYFGKWAPQDTLFLISIFVLTGSFILSFLRHRKSGSPDLRLQYIKTRIFDLMLVATTIALSLRIQRNIPLYALSLWPVMSENLDLRGQVPFLLQKRYLTPLLYVGVIFLLVASIYLVVSGKFYNWLDSPKIFGLEVSSATQDGTDFIKQNKIRGPVFNNFDIGSYLAWQLYPDQKVFVDGRPEAYPVELFDKIYKPMQRDEKVWQEMSEKYDINYVFFAHTDMTEWADEFLIRVSKDKKWPIVFLNDAVVVFLKNTEANQSVVGQYQITEQNIIGKIPQVLSKLNKKDDNAFINFGNVFYRFRWLSASAKVYEALIVNQPSNPYGYQGAGYAYAMMNEPVTQEKARQNLKKAIDLGFKTFNNYFTLGIINANLGNLIEAEENLEQAIKINPNSQNAKQVLETIRQKSYYK